MHCVDAGTGPPVVLLHGIAASHQSFTGWIDELSGTYRVIAVDLPGHGLTGPDPQGRYSWREMAGLVHGLAAALELDRFVLCGNSLGGAVAAELALMHPDRVQALVLIAAIGAPPAGPMPPPLKAMARPLLGRLLSWMTPRFVVRQVLASTYADPERLTDAEVDAAYHLTRRAGNRRAARQVLLRGPRQGLADRIGNLSVPVLILWGAEDSWLPVSRAEWFADRIGDARIVRFDHLGHLPMAEDPRVTAEALRAFLAGLDQRSVASDQ
jgi:pimeloyl-ACP methyl ester carboxylesterase